MLTATGETHEDPPEEDSTYRKCPRWSHLEADSGWGLLRAGGRDCSGPGVSPGDDENVLRLTVTMAARWNILSATELYFEGAARM